MTSSKTARSILYFVFSLALTVAVFAYLFTHITWAEVVGLIVNINQPLLVAFLALSTAMQVVRTLRYRVILNSVGQHPGFFRLFLVVLVRGFCVDLLPARAGELVYIYILRVRLGLDLGAATASFALAFLFDMTALTPLILLALFLVGSGISMSPVVLAGAGIALFAVAVALIYVFPSALKLAFRITGRLKFIAARLRRWLLRLIASTHRQVRRTQQRGVYLPVFGYSVLVRIFKYTGLYVLLLALLAPQGYTTGDLPFAKVFLGLVAAEMTASLPISGIGGFGAYQGMWSFVFTVLGFPADLAKVTSVSHHVFSQVYAYSLGLAALLLLMVVRPRARK